MQPGPYIADATPENFEELVLANSAKGPVLVNYWAPWAGPCLKLWPVLEKLAHEFGGRFLLVNVNAEAHRELARVYGVNSLPTLKLFRNGQVVEQVHGADSEAGLRRTISRHLPRASDKEIAAAVHRYQAGDGDSALRELARIAERDPENPRASLALAKLLLREERFAEAERALLALPEAVRTQREPGALLAHATFMQALADAPERAVLERRVADAPHDLGARFQLAALEVVADRYEEAILQLLEILRRDRSYRDAAALRGLNAVFDLLGRSHPLSQTYRPRALSLLH